MPSGIRHTTRTLLNIILHDSSLNYKNNKTMQHGIATGTGDVMDTFLNNGLNDR